MSDHDLFVQEEGDVDRMEAILRHSTRRAQEELPLVLVQLPGTAQPGAGQERAAAPQSGGPRRVTIMNPGASPSAGDDPMWHYHQNVVLKKSQLQQRAGDDLSSQRISRVMGNSQAEQVVMVVQSPGVRFPVAFNVEEDRETPPDSSKARKSPQETRDDTWTSSDARGSDDTEREDDMRNSSKTKRTEESERRNDMRASSTVRKPEESERGSAKGASSAVRKPEESERGSAKGASSAVRKPEESERGSAKGASSAVRKPQESERGSAMRGPGTVRKPEESERGSAKGASSAVRKPQESERGSAMRAPSTVRKPEDSERGSAMRAPSKVKKGAEENGKRQSGGNTEVADDSKIAKYVSKELIENDIKSITERERGSAEPGPDHEEHMTALDAIWHSMDGTDAKEINTSAEQTPTDEKSRSKGSKKSDEMKLSTDTTVMLAQQPFTGQQSPFLPQDRGKVEITLFPAQYSFTDQQSPFNYQKNKDEIKPNPSSRVRVLIMLDKADDDESVFDDKDSRGPYDEDGKQKGRPGRGGRPGGDDYGGDKGGDRGRGRGGKPGRGKPGQRPGYDDGTDDDDRSKRGGRGGRPGRGKPGQGPGYDDGTDDDDRSKRGGRGGRPGTGDRDPDRKTRPGRGKGGYDDDDQTTLASHSTRDGDKRPGGRGKGPRSGPGEDDRSRGGRKPGGRDPDKKYKPRPGPDARDGDSQTTQGRRPGDREDGRSVRSARSDKGRGRGKPGGDTDNARYRTVAMPKSATKLTSRRRYHLQVTDPEMKEPWFNSCFNISKENNVDFNYEGPVKITPYYVGDKIS